MTDLSRARCWRIYRSNRHETGGGLHRNRFFADLSVPWLNARVDSGEQGMLPRPLRDREGYDIFVSFAHASGQVDDSEKVSVLVKAIEVEYEREIGDRLRVYQSDRTVQSIQDWEATDLPALRQSRLMLAVLSPAYFATAACRREWEHYLEGELAQAVPEEGIILIYAARYPAFEADPVEEGKQAWIKDLRRRWCIDLLSCWPRGTSAGQAEEWRRNLGGLPGQIADRLLRTAVRDASTSTIPLPGHHFVGRREEAPCRSRQPCRDPAMCSRPATAFPETARARLLSPMPGDTEPGIPEDGSSSRRRVSATRPQG